MPCSSENIRERFKNVQKTKEIPRRCEHLEGIFCVPSKSVEFILLTHKDSVETLRDRAVTPEGHPRDLLHADGVEDDELNGVERGRREHGEDEDAVVLLGGAGPGHEDGLGDEVAGVLPRDDVARRRVDLQDLERGP